MNHDYGNCHVCGEVIQERLTDQSIREGNDWLVVRDVPTGVCIRCGEQVFRWEVSERLEHIVVERSRERPVESLQVPVFAY